MLKAIALFAVGLILLIKGGDWFVDGATGIAKRFHIPELLIGATVVSIGTTLPEVMVSATSAVTGHGEIAYGNAIGSVICNTSLIAALTIAVAPSRVDKRTFSLPVLFFFLAAAAYAAVSYTIGYFSRFFGICMLAVFILYIAISAVRAVKGTLVLEPEEGENEEEKDMPLWKQLLLLLAGAAIIAVGADLLVDNGTIIAQDMGVPESVIALTFVALGTSLPELVTAVTSLIKGHSSLSLGNIVGANLFNLVLVCGVSTALSPFSIPSSKLIAGMPSSLVIEIPLMVIVMCIMTLPALKNGKVTRTQGILLLAIYAAFCVYQFAF